LGDVAATDEVHRCKDCDKWYGAEDDEYGPCMYKHVRKEARYLTYGRHVCDEEEELRRRGKLWQRESPRSGE
jgi:hypothetical protein